MSSLSSAAYELLQLIAEHTTRDESGNLTSYWVPRSTPEYVKELKRTIVVSGAGDAARIRGFIRNGLVKPQPVAPYACSLTEEGLLTLENYRQKHVYVDGRIPA